MGNCCCLGCCPASASPPPHSDPQSASTLTSQSPQSSQAQIVDLEQLKNIIEQLKKIKDADQLDLLIRYIDRMLKPEQSAQSTEAESSKTREFVTDNVGSASKLLDHLSTEGEKLHESNFSEDMGNVVSKVLEGLGTVHWIALGLFVIAFAIQTKHKVSANVEKCLELLDMLFTLAKHLTEQYKLMRKESETINKAVRGIVDGVIICCACIQQTTLFRYLFALSNEQKLERIERRIKIVQMELNLTIGTDIQGRTADIQGRIADIPRQHFVSGYSCPVDAVGIEHKVEEVIKLLDVGGKAERRAVILHGFGGVGKTTLADCVMSRLDLKAFKHSKIELDEKQLDVRSYQQKLCKYLTGKILNFQDSSEGRDKLKEALEKESTFICIDNALSKEQIGKLLPADLALPADSRMLVTTRDLAVNEELRDRKIDCQVYRVEELPPDAAKEFFREIVKRCVPANSKIASLGKLNAVAEQCHGVPLLLNVYARYLAGHEEPEVVCDEMLDFFRKGDFSYADTNVDKRLLYIYEKLRQDDKDAFLDVCTYFHGWSKKKVSYILRKRELNALLDGALLNINSSGNVVVHDVLRAMGIKLGEDSRVQRDHWQTALAGKEFKGMWLCGRESDDVLDVECQRLREVRILALGERVRLTGECRVSLPKLRYLRIQNLSGQFPIFEGMHALQYAKLIYGGEDSPSSHTLWENVKSMPNIKKLHLHVERIKKFPADFRFPESLIELDVRYCKSVESLPDGFGTLSALQTLDLWGCGSLVSLPDGFGNLSALQTLHLEGCESLVSLPDGFGTLSALQTLHLEGCEKLASLPDGFGTLSALQTLHLWGCGSLVSLPDGFGTLSALQTLHLWVCGSLVSLPDGFGTLSALQTLELRRCGSLVSLPDGFGTLSALQTLKLIECRSLVNLPEGFGTLESLEDLAMGNCSNLKTLSDDFDSLAALTILNLTCCPKLSGNTMEKLTKLKSLKRLIIKGSTELELKWKEMETEKFNFELVN